MVGLAELALVLVILLVAVVALFIAVRVIARGLFGRDRRLERSIGMEVLDARLRRGEITREEYDQARKALGG